MGIIAFLVNMVLFAYLAFWLPYVMVCVTTCRLNQLILCGLATQSMICAAK